MPDQTPSGLLNLQLPLLQQAEAKTEASVPAAQKATYLRILVAGMKVALNRGPAGLLGQLQKSKTPLSDCVRGSVGIVGLLRRESSGTMPVPVMVPAGFSLVLHGLDFLQKMGVMQIDANALATATHLYSETVMAALKITPQKVQQLAAMAHSTMQDPQAMSTLQAKMNGGQ